MNNNKNISTYMYQWTYWFCFISTGCTLLLFTSVLAEESKKVCETEACKNTAQRILEYMDDGVKPCDDFYSFACGKFLKTAEHEDFVQLEKLLDQRLITALEKVTPDDPQPYQYVKQLYSLCVDEDKINARGVEPALSQLKLAGGWPVLGDWKGDNWNFIDTEIKLNNLAIGGGNLFGIFVAVDVKNNNRRILQIFIPRLGIHMRDLMEGENNEKVKSYFSYMVDLAEMYGADRQTATDQFKQSLLFEMELVKLFPEIKNEELSKLRNIFTLKELKAEIGWIDWTKLFKSLMPETVQLTEDEPIAVWDVEFLKKLEQFLSNHPKEVIANYMVWHAASDMVTELTADMRSRRQKFIEETTGIDDPPSPRWKSCIDDIPSIGLASLYITKYFEETTKKEAIHMTDLILKEVELELEKVDWMDEKTRVKALTKASKIIKNIGYPDELADIGLIERYYEGVEMSKANYFEAVYDIARWAAKKSFQPLHEPFRKDDWIIHSNIHEASLYYDLNDNSIRMPKKL